MSYALAVIMGLVVGMLAKGKLSNLFNIRLNKVWLILSAFCITAAVQIASREIRFNTVVTMAFQVVMLLLLAAGFWFNRNRLGVCIIAVGYFLNFLVIMLNGGKMPVSIEVIKKSGLIQSLDDIDIKHNIFSNADKIKLPFLADIIHPPYFLSYGMDIISVGDIVIALGLFVLTVELVIGKKIGGLNIWELLK